MLECGFCGGTLTRRNWHSGSQYSKVIWQCVTATKKGKKFCKHSKGIPETAIEEAFVESYRLLCDDNKDVLEEFCREWTILLVVVWCQNNLQKRKRR